MSLAAIDVGIKGISPLLMHRHPAEMPENFPKLPPEEQAEIVAYRDETGNLCIPALNVQRALVAGASYSKGKGRSTLAKAAAACVLISPEYLDLGVKTYKVDSRWVTIKGCGQVMRHRPRFNNWAVSFRLEYDDMLLNEAQARRIVDDTCSRVGFLDFRPACKGPFGRAMVTSWKPVK